MLASGPQSRAPAVSGERARDGPGVRRRRRSERDEYAVLMRTDRGIRVNKQELIDAVAEAADLSKASAGRAVDATLEAIRNAMREGDAVALVGFGTFYVGKRAGRTGRNPRTGAPIRIKAAKLPKFRPGKPLRDALN